MRSMNEERKRYPAAAQTILRGIDILDAFVAAGGKPMGMTEVSRRVGLNRMSAHRALVALAARNLLYYDPQLEKYTLGLRLVEYGYAAQHALPIVALAAPTLERLRDLSGESVALVLRDGDYGVIAAAALSTEPLRWVPEVGQTHPGIVGVTDLVFWADLPDEEVRARLGDSRFYDRSATDVSEDELNAQLAQVRTTGSAILTRPANGLAAIAFPVRSAGTRLLAAIAVSGPINRLTRKRMVALRPEMSASVAELERKLGHR
jgi:DNA-binding IclR family transcriptional regulator